MTEKKFILLAEDDEQIAKLVVFTLTHAGFIVRVARNGQDAIDCFGASPWSLVILDIMMPKRDGWQVLQDLRSSGWVKVPVLILSAKGLGGGLPISAVTGRSEMMDAPQEGGIGGTFGGNPVSCAAALA